MEDKKMIKVFDINEKQFVTLKKKTTTYFESKNVFCTFLMFKFKAFMILLCVDIFLSPDRT